MNYATTIMGDRMPSADEWILMLSNRIETSHEAFADISSWQVDGDGIIRVIYRSGREEEYKFSLSCVGSGLFLGV